MFEVLGTNIFAAVVLFGILVFVHEWGHFIMCRFVGVRVEKFSLGFGPRIWSKQIGDTEYMVSWIPLGGYVKMAGEEPQDDVPAKDWEYFGKRPFHKALILSGGVLMNMVLAVFLYCAIFAMEGKVIQTSQFMEVTPGYPAEEVGLLPKDQIVAIDGRPIRTWFELVEIVQDSANQELRIRVRRDETEFETTIIPKEEVSEDMLGIKRGVGRLGISSPMITTEELSFGHAIVEGVGHTLYLTKTMYVVLWKLVTGQMSVKGLGGPIMIAKLAGDTARLGVISFLNLVAVISINLAVMNFLPIPVLDGGHMFFVLVESIRKRPVSMRVQEQAQKFGLAVLLLLLVLVFYIDIERFVFRKKPSGSDVQKTESVKSQESTQEPSSTKNSQ